MVSLVTVKTGRTIIYDWGSRIGWEYCDDDGGRTIIYDKRTRMGRSMVMVKMGRTIIYDKRTRMARSMVTEKMGGPLLTLWDYDVWEYIVTMTVVRCVSMTTRPLYQFIIL